ncbi:hybrid sensor histidine kinase/response regulator [Rhizobium tumorigenes]|uniref:hybrid sensor histidine kinase/response regulator n=1 Tax=Rhizobium tumorigenes TaxID=2041385 RepID=UPI00241FFC3E|nr:ATP-binding protein [Rhizobium tumorigenes]WFS01089.1 ATP-binding protein [Rhizobium tumorigenes]
MNTPADLQKRLSSAFGQALSEPPGNPDVTPPDNTGFTVPDPSLSSSRFGRLWLGGAGIVTGGLLLAAGYVAGAAALAGVVGIFGLAVLSAAVISRSNRSTAKSTPLASAEPHASSTAPLDPPAPGLNFSSDIHDALGDIAVTRGLNRRILHANATFRLVTGKARPEGMTCDEIGIAFRPDDRPDHYDVEIATPQGQRIYSWRDVMMRDPASGQLRIESVARDITDQRLATREREQARLKAEHESAAKSQLLATVSHEIRTPLSGIMGMSHLIGQTGLTPAQESYLDGIRQSGQALVQLVEDLLDFSTLESGRFQIHPRAESLRRLIESVVEMLAHRAHEKGIEIGATVHSDIPELMSFDPARLRQVLFNVIGNAVKFTQRGGVLVRAAYDDGDLVITVQDSGPGMTPEEQARVFGAFEQAGDASEKSGGTGLGLTISARIVEEFGGRMSVVSERGVGSQFIVRFPVELPADQRSRNHRATMLKSSRVLLIAPDGPAATATAETIRMLGGTCRLIEAGDAGNFALDTLMEAEGPPTDVIVDNRMAPHFLSQFADRLGVIAPGLRRIFLVTPEQRNAEEFDMFDAWLIRPLREQSLIDVLRGRMRGMERRDAINDNQPGFMTLPELPEGTGISIVLAEDDPVNAMLVRAVLTKAGHAVDVVQDVESLLDRAWHAGHSRPDIIVTDLSMPGGDGVEMLGRLRAHERRQGLPPVPVIVLTADSRDETRRAALLNGASIVLAKPADPQRLIQEVETLAAMTVDFARQS